MTEAIWAANSKATGSRVPQPLGAKIMAPGALHAGRGAAGFSIGLAEFQSGFGLTLPFVLFLPFAMGFFTLCHCILGVCNLFLILQGLTSECLP
jgi:hypothetical protein